MTEIRLEELDPQEHILPDAIPDHTDDSNPDCQDENDDWSYELSGNLIKTISDIATIQKCNEKPKDKDGPKTAVKSRDIGHMVRNEGSSLTLKASLAINVSEHKKNSDKNPDESKPDIVADIHIEKLEGQAQDSISSDDGTKSCF